MPAHFIAPFVSEKIQFVATFLKPNALYLIKRLFCPDEIGMVSKKMGCSTAARRSVGNSFFVAIFIKKVL